ncbi:gluconokinase [Halomonas elongata]|uniref:Gluconokinase n=1 Tax=Halomonas elongata (strain ATCC 33173 / DSM 2581 / NBRC 15536 / NCIMB 2198 / 1H9) TaxID=768066 RepID=E1V8P1_HALED|nr:gluconokinase [Halomonas elongata]WBF18906.1 gluconokinase [Halomonas elongata]WPU47765.1 gluconokinase [Halomonas elongata DSM 2581]CBV41666.1 gluconokinase [Halomonas elongata DSM 2581]
MKAKTKSILVMGVSGSGKSHIGRQLAAAIDATFLDGDDYHSSESVAKMSRGQPLNDGDRETWLATLADLYREYQERGVSLVIGCSALKHRYRDQLRAATPRLDILYLHGDRDVLLERLERRSEHFFTGSHMLDSQLATLEVPSRDEAFRSDIRDTPRDIVSAYMEYLDTPSE